MLRRPHTPRLRTTGPTTSNGTGSAPPPPAHPPRGQTARSGSSRARSLAPPPRRPDRCPDTCPSPTRRCACGAGHRRGRDSPRARRTTTRGSPRPRGMCRDRTRKKCYAGLYSREFIWVGGSPNRAGPPTVAGEIGQSSAHAGLRRRIAGCDALLAMLILGALPRLAHLPTYAARCARRVEPLFHKAWPEAPHHLLTAVAEAVEYAEQAAANVHSQKDLAQYHANVADAAAARADR